jgi:glucose/arabinose dehydrogenase
MKTNPLLYIVGLLCLSATMSCGQKKKPNPADAATVKNAAQQTVNLPPPYQTKSTSLYSHVIGWPANKMPTAPAGFKVNLFATDMDNPRNIYIAPNGDVFISQANTEKNAIVRVAANITGPGKSQKLGKSANNIVLLRDVNGDGIPDTKTVFLSGLNQPYGMLIVGNWFYVANTDGLLRYPYKAGQTKITTPGKMILSLPAGGYNNHWTRNLRANSAGTKIYVSVGSGSNHGDHGMQNEVRRADILEINPDGSGERIYASGLRNPAGIDFQPGTGVLYASVNERDGLGDNLVPDYLTSVKEGGFYGWPYAYFGPHEDPDHKGQRPDLVKKTIVPDVALGSHTASLGLAFYGAKAFPARYQNGAFIGQHGSWNSSTLIGYKVVFVPFSNHKPGKPEDFLTGFIANLDKHEVYGRPVGVAVAKDGALLVADDTGNKIWRVTAK